MSDFATRLEGTGEFVDGQALAPEGSWVRYDGEGRPPVTDGPFAETKDLIAGWMIIDVDTHERALELAGELSAAPGAGGKPIHEWLEVRPFLHAPADHRRSDRPTWTRSCSAASPRASSASSSAAEPTSRRPRTPCRTRWWRRSAPGPTTRRVTRWAGWSPWPGAGSSTRPGRRRRAVAARTSSTRSRRPGPPTSVDDTLQLYFLCAHPSLTPASAVALTLRAVGGLTTRQIAQAYLVPEATMAQRISRAKRTVSDVRLDQPGDVATVLRVLYLVFNEGYSGDVDLAEEAIRLTRQLAGSDRPPRGVRAAGADAAAPRPPRRPHRGRRQPGRRWPSRTAPLGHRHDRRGCRDPPGRAGPRPAGRVPGPGRHRGAARRRAAPPRRPTGCRSWSGTTSWRG